jgi:hypothetical protein
MQHDLRADLTAQPFQGALQIWVGPVLADLLPPAIASDLKGQRFSAGRSVFGDDPLGFRPVAPLGFLSVTFIFALCGPGKAKTRDLEIVLVIWGFLDPED